jgi:hypothetical protein
MQMSKKVASRVKKRPRLRLGETNCKYFEVTIEASDKDFDHDKFLRAIPFKDAGERFRTRGRFFTICNRRTSQIDYRAEINIHRLVNQPRDVAIHVILRPSKGGPTKGETSPFAEEVSQWVLQFISKNASVDLLERCEFVFSARRYQSVFSLPLPMSGLVNPTGNPVFEGSSMVGVRIVFGRNQVGASSVIHEFVPKTGIVVSLRRRTTADSAKLLTVERDVGVLYNMAVSTVRTKGKSR